MRPQGILAACKPLCKRYNYMLITVLGAYAACDSSMYISSYLGGNFSMRHFIRFIGFSLYRHITFYNIN